LRPRDLPLSLQARIMGFIALILTTGAIFLGLAAWQYARVAAQEAYDRLLVGGATQIAENIYVQGGVVTLDPPAAAFSTLSSYDNVFYKVVDPRGVVIAGYANLSSAASLEMMRKGVVLTDATYDGQNVRVAAVGKLIDDPQIGGWVEVVVAQTVRARDALSWDLTTKAAGIIGVMSVLALLAGAFSVRLALAPLIRIEKEIAGRKPDDLRPIRVTAPLEVRALVSAIDEFMRRLSGRIQIMQRFIADAAHQIRTPLAALDGRLELLSAEGSPADRAEQIARAREKSAELARLTNQLLGHAMIIHRTEAIRFETFDLNTLAKSVLAQSVPLSFGREVSVSFGQDQDHLMVEADPISMREAISNLIHNALTHGAATRLSVNVDADATMARVSVSDDGPGIPKCEQSRLREPFQVGSSAPGGSGLGLAIAADVAKAHGGSLEFLSGEKWFSVVLVLPITHGGSV
jgi:two-component system sensor histidine kinase TctE